MVHTLQRHLVVDFVCLTYGLQGRRILTQVLARPQFEQVGAHCRGALLQLKVARQIV